MHVSKPSVSPPLLLVYILTICFFVETKVDPYFNIILMVAF